MNNEYRDQLVKAGLVVSGTFQEGRLVEIIELPDHPWFVASQFHPEFKSRPTRPAPLFRDFVGAAARACRRAHVRSGDARRHERLDPPKIAPCPKTRSSRSSPSSRRCRARPARSARSPITSAPTCAISAWTSRGRRGVEDRLERGEPLCAGRGDRRRHAVLPLRPPGHRPARGRDRAGGRGRRRSETPRGTILGADNKAAVAVMLEATRRVLAENRPHGGIELLFTPKEEVGLHGRGRVRPRAARRRASATSTTRRLRSAR